mmetsp:Transcript_14155/g.20658  ORF Transcript_14155/g.20658 Transcript_14155/m.20658 type:complete len:306 (+) Transcript_14155:90-1007(+)
MDPDELYTLRAQYWLGHYDLCLTEGRSLIRRPMAPHLKIEREEFVLRAQLALGEFATVIKNASGNGKAASIRALGLRAQYESPNATDDDKATIVAQFQSLLADNESANNASVQLTACHVFLLQGEMTREALQCVHLGLTMEHLAMSLQLYLKMDRLDLAEEQLGLMKQGDEDAILTQLCSAYLAIATGRSKSDDAIYSLNSLMEQYGPSPLLSNCMAVSQIVGGKYEKAEGLLKETLDSHPGDVDAMVNLVVVYQHLGNKSKELEEVLDKLRKEHKDHFFVKGLERVEGALEREAGKYVTGVAAS